MAASRLPELAGAVCLWCAAAAGQAAQIEPGEPVAYSADVVNSDFRSNTIELSGNVRVTQGTMSIEAQEATGTDVRSDSGRWTFEDSVHIRTAQADLQSNSASAAIVDGQIASARIEGSPAEFAQRGESAEGQVRGRAGVIEYDFNGGVVRMEDQVWFTNGKDEFRGDVVIYNVRDERLQINPDGHSSGRVRGIIRPRDPRTETGGSTEPPADAPDPERRAPEENGA